MNPRSTSSPFHALSVLTATLAIACGGTVAPSQDGNSLLDEGLSDTMNIADHGDSRPILDAALDGPADVAIDTSTTRPDRAFEIGTCDHLPAPGAWEQITPSGFAQGNALVRDPFNGSVVWMNVNNAGIFRSSDCGASFVHVNTGRNGDRLDHGGILSMAIDPVDQGTMYAVAIYGSTGAWKSTDAGIDWDQLFPDGGDVATTVTDNFFDSVAIDPNDHLHLVFGPHQSCRAPFNPACEVVTLDGGATSRIVRVPAPGFEEGAGPWILGPTSWLYSGPHLALTTDSGANWQVLDPDPATFYAFNAGEDEVQPIVTGPDGSLYLGAGQGIIRSTNGGHSWNLTASGGATNALTGSADGIFVTNLFNATVRHALFSDLSTWTTIDAPVGVSASQNCAWVQYDDARHLLYISCFYSGAWRMRTE